MERVRFGAIHGRIAELTSAFEEAAAIIRNEPDVGLRDDVEVNLTIMRGRLEKLRFRSNQLTSLTADGFETIGKELTKLEDALKSFRTRYITESARRRNMVRQQIIYQDRSIVPLTMKTLEENNWKDPKKARGSKLRTSYNRSASQQPGSGTLGQSSSRHSPYGGGSVVHGGGSIGPVQHLQATHSQMPPPLQYPHGSAYLFGVNQYQSQSGYPPPTGFPQTGSTDVIVYPPTMSSQAQYPPYGSHSHQYVSAPQGYSFPPQGQMGGGQNPGLQGHHSSQQGHSSGHARNSSSTLDDLYDIYGNPE